MLPENWYVKITLENREALAKWRFDREDWSSKLQIGGYVGWVKEFDVIKESKSSYSKGHNERDNLIKDDYYDFGEEITFEEFQREVLKQPKEFPKQWSVQGGEGLSGLFVEIAKINSSFKNRGFDGKLWFYNFNGEYLLKSTTLGPIYPTVTIEELRNHYLKQPTMETRKIIGFKAPTDLFSGIVPKDTIFKYRGAASSSLYPDVKESHISNACSLPKEIVETWEAVYEQEFKVGDWVVNKHDPSIVGWIRKIELNIAYFEQNACHIDTLRKATPQEIEASKEIKVGGYVAEFKGNEVTFGCQTFSITEIESYKRLLGRTRLTAQISINGIPITIELLDKILNRMK